MVLTHRKFGALCAGVGVWDNGLHWRVGTGNFIQFYRDAWIPTLSGGQLFSRLALGSFISGFILPNSRWNGELMEAAFLPLEVEAIMRIPINSTLSCDGIF